MRKNVGLQSTLLAAILSLNATSTNVSLAQSSADWYAGCSYKAEIGAKTHADGLLRLFVYHPVALPSCSLIY